MTPIGLKATFEKQLAIKGSKVTVEFSVHKATAKKEMALTTVLKQVLGPITEGYVKPVSNKSVA